MSKSRSRHSKSARALITVGSLIGFVGAWGFFSQANKPAAAQIAPLLESLPTPSQQQSQFNPRATLHQADPLPTIPSQQTLPVRQRSRLRTGGS